LLLFCNLSDLVNYSTVQLLKNAEKGIRLWKCDDNFNEWF
jgi:hypothetical protein